MLLHFNNISLDQSINLPETRTKLTNPAKFDVCQATVIDPKRDPPKQPYYRLRQSIGHQTKHLDVIWSLRKFCLESKCQQNKSFWEKPHEQTWGTRMSEWKKTSKQKFGMNYKPMHLALLSYPGVSAISESIIIKFGKH